MELERQEDHQANAKNGGDRREKERKLTCDAASLLARNVIHTWKIRAINSCPSDTASARAESVERRSVC